MAAEMGPKFTGPEVAAARPKCPQDLTHLALRRNGQFVPTTDKPSAEVLWFGGKWRRGTHSATVLMSAVVLTSGATLANNGEGRPEQGMCVRKARAACCIHEPRSIHERKHGLLQSFGP
jgi:hypothetical protein